MSTAGWYLIDSRAATVLRRDQQHFVSERGQFPCPVVTTAAGFDGDRGRRQFLEERQRLGALEIAAQHRFVGLIDAM